MAIEYLGLSEINGPLVVLEGVKNASYEEIVEFHMDDGTRKIGRIIEIYEDKAVIQVFEGTDGMSLGNTHTRLTGRPMEIGLSPEILGRTFNGIGQPIDGLGDITPDVKLNINGLPLNPVAREYPRNYINTGISAIDGLTTLIRGQKLPIFSGNGLPHDKLAAQIVQQASLGEDSDEDFAIVFAAMGVKYDVAEFFRRTFEESGAADHVVMFLNLANDPVVERLLTPKIALTAAEYLAFEKGMHILVILTDITSFCEAMREVSSYFVEAPSTMNELLMAHYLLKTTPDKRFRRWVLSCMISNTYYHNFVTHLMEAAYQREVYKLIDAGDSVQAETLSSIMKETLQKFWGDDVEISDDAALTWMRQPHYYMGLYSYTYSAGLTVATQVCKRIETEGQTAVDDWKKVLTAGSTKTPEELAKMAGVDISTDAPLLDTIETIGSIIDEICELTEELGC